MIDVALPVLPDDDELRSAITKLVGAGHFCRFLVGQLVGALEDAGESKRLERILREHATDLTKAEDIMVGWATHLGLDAEGSSQARNGNDTGK